MRILNRFILALPLALVAGSSIANAAEDSKTPLYEDGIYADVLARGVKFDSKTELDAGLGATLAVGVRRGPIALEVTGSYTGTRSPSATLIGASVNGLVFPSKGLGLFGIVGVGVTNVADYPNIGGHDFNVTTIDAGLGYLFSFKMGDRPLGLRAQLVYEYGKRESRAQDQLPPAKDLAVESQIDNIIASIGLQIPFGSAAPSAVEPPTEVVPVEPPPQPAPL